MSDASNIAQTDPLASYLGLKAEVDDAIQRVLSSGSYILGAEVSAFEAEFAAFIGSAAAIGCANGTDALALALRAMGVGPGSTVATVSHTAVATVAAIEMTGATPLLLDIDEATYTLDAVELDAVLSRPRAGLAPIRAIVPVHLYGQPADLDRICLIATRHGIPVIEDCAQAHGAIFQGRRVGAWGQAGAFSFYPTKNLGAFGDGGALVTSDPELADRAAALRQYGWGTDRISKFAGVNSRLDELHAAVLRLKLARLDADNARRSVIAAAYDVALQGSGARPPGRRSDRTHVYHQYVIRRPDRLDFQNRLLEKGIRTAIHYPVPVHLQPAFAGRVELGPSNCRDTEAISQEIVSLPMHPHLTDAQVERVCAVLRVT
jgi:dTDP-4-amino-4,6-dideoxygalactose transaminase